MSNTTHMPKTGLYPALVDLADARKERNTAFANSCWDENGQCYTFDLWCMFAGWDGGTIHEALRYFKDMTKDRQDEFCGMLIKAIDHDQLKDLASGWAAQFTRARIGLS